MVVYYCQTFKSHENMPVTITTLCLEVGVVDVKNKTSAYYILFCSSLVKSKQTGLQSEELK